MKKNNYGIFMYMLAISFIIMYGVMFLNVADSSHIYLSLTRTYMALLMVAPMAIFMLLLMGNMYPNKKVNGIIIVTTLVIFSLSLAGLRTQTGVTDEQYMKAMIPHHSSAILTSEQADLKDPELKKLAEGIIEAQKKEIAQMKAILKRMEN